MLVLMPSSPMHASTAAAQPVAAVRQAVHPGGTFPCQATRQSDDPGTPQTAAQESAQAHVTTARYFDCEGTQMVLGDTMLFIASLQRGQAKDVVPPLELLATLPPLPPEPPLPLAAELLAVDAEPPTPLLDALDAEPLAPTPLLDALDALDEELPAPPTPAEVLVPSAGAPPLPLVDAALPAPPTPPLAALLVAVPEPGAPPLPAAATVTAAPPTPLLDTPDEDCPPEVSLSSMTTLVRHPIRRARAGSEMVTKCFMGVPRAGRSVRRAMRPVAGSTVLGGPA